MQQFLQITFGILFGINLYYFILFLVFMRHYKRVLPPQEKSTIQKIKKVPLIKRILIDVPRQMAYDRVNRNPNTFQDYGFHMVCGKQGSGKTVTVAYLLRQYQRQYPLLKVKTNFNYLSEDAPITHWSDLTTDSNSIYGEVDVIDEVQNWFSSNASKNFPPEFLTVITQQRKVRRMILGTAQVFGRIAKPLREQTYLLYLPITLFGCMTIVRVYDFDLDEDANIDDKKLRKIFMFVHDKDLRESFDSYATVAKMAESGFHEGIPVTPNIIIKDDIEQSGRRKRKVI